MPLADNNNFTSLFIIINHFFLLFFCLCFVVILRVFCMRCLTKGELCTGFYESPSEFKYFNLAGERYVLFERRSLPAIRDLNSSLSLFFFSSFTFSFFSRLITLRSASFGSSPAFFAISFVHFSSCSALCSVWLAFSRFLALLTNSEK